MGDRWVHKCPRRDESTHQPDHRLAKVLSIESELTLTKKSKADGALPLLHGFCGGEGRGGGGCWENIQHPTSNAEVAALRRNRVGRASSLPCVGVSRRFVRAHVLTGQAGSPPYAGSRGAAGANLDVGCWMLDVGCWMLDVFSRSPHPSGRQSRQASRLPGKRASASVRRLCRREAGETRALPIGNRSFIRRAFAAKCGR